MVNPWRVQKSNNKTLLWFSLGEGHSSQPLHSRSQWHSPCEPWSPPAELGSHWGKHSEAPPPRTPKRVVNLLFCFGAEPQTWATAHPTLCLMPMAPSTGGELIRRGGHLASSGWVKSWPDGDPVNCFLAREDVQWCYPIFFKNPISFLIYCMLRCVSLFVGLHKELQQFPNVMNLHIFSNTPFWFWFFD